MIRKCFISTCNVTEDTDSNRILLHLDHIVPRGLFPKSYNLYKKYDMIEIDGKLVSNREYICIEHHLVKTKKDMKYINAAKIMTEEQRRKLRITVYHNYYNEFIKKLGENGNTKPTEKEGV